MDDELVEGVSAVVAAEAKNKDDDLDLALDALRDCDTDFIKFDQVHKEFNLKGMYFITLFLPLSGKLRLELSTRTTYQI